MLGLVLSCATASLDFKFEVAGREPLMFAGLTAQPDLWGTTAYADNRSMFTFGSDGFMVGTVWNDSSWFTLTRERWGEDAQIQPHDDAGHCAVGAASTNRTRRYDQWWQRSACYQSSSVRPVHVSMTLVVGANAIASFGGAKRTRGHMAHMVRMANNVFGGHLNMQLAVDELILSNGTLPMDSTRTEAGCAQNAGSTLDKLSGWVAGRGNALLHYVDDCRPRTGGSYTSGMAWIGVLCHPTHNAGVTYVSAEADETWHTFAHEVGHNLGANHPFVKDQTLAGTIGGLMDYYKPWVRQRSGVLLEAFNTESTKADICAHVGAVVGTPQCDGKVRHLTAAEHAVRVGRWFWLPVGLGVGAAVALAVVCIVRSRPVPAAGMYVRL
jgi:hypothetical protein